MNPSDPRKPTARLTERTSEYLCFVRWSKQPKRHAPLSLQTVVGNAMPLAARKSVAEDCAYV
jgi:hypothetical protein